MTQKKVSKATILTLSQIKSKVCRTPELRWSTVVAAASLGSMAGSMSPASFNQVRDVHTNAWIGQNIDGVVEQLGQPTQSHGLIRGGRLVIYSKPDGQRYVFQTAAGGRIVKAARID